MVNGKGKSHVKLYLDHDTGRLEKRPLASSSSSSLRAQLLQALWAWHWASNCCREKQVSQVHSVQAAIREKERGKISETSSINYKSNKVAFSVNNKVYRVMLAIRYDTQLKTLHVPLTVRLVSYRTTCWPSISSVCLSPVEINKLLRVRVEISLSLTQMLRFYVTFVVVLASSAALGNGICYSLLLCVITQIYRVQ